MKKGKLIFLLIYFSGILAGCTKDTVKPTVLPSTLSAIKFSTELQPTFTSSCAVSGCHDGSNMPPNLTSGNSYNGIMDAGVVDTNDVANSIIYKKINTGGTMSSYTNPAFASKVLQWITEGAKNN